MENITRLSPRVAEALAELDQIKFAMALQHCAFDKFLQDNDDLLNDKEESLFERLFCKRINEVYAIINDAHEWITYGEASEITDSLVMKTASIRE